MNPALLPVVCQTALLLSAASPSPSSESAPTLSVQGDAAAGHVTAQWAASQPASGTEFLLQQSADSNFSDTRTRYQGPHHASVLSGLPNGSYYFRVRSRRSAEQPWGAWSSAQAFTVRHHSRSLAFVLFGVGAAVFGLTLAFLLVSARKAS